MLEFTKTRSKLIDWYNHNKRDLPWRQTKDPYCIWISEVILQQTKVNQGLEYYRKFIARFPNVGKLAEANLDEVLKYWQGLGYYSRARNLHFAAKQVVVTFNGKFPGSVDELLKLKGIGKYTAAAIASIAFKIPVAVVDGNVFRVIARFTGNTAPIDLGSSYNSYYRTAEELMGQADPSLFNQAMMELGALVCTVRNPLCGECPFKQSCVAKEQGLIDLLPIKIKKVKTVDRYFNYLVLSYRDSLVLHKRMEKDIWQSLYDFPIYETLKSFTLDEFITSNWIFSNFNIKEPLISGISGPFKHQLTHQTIYTTFIRVRLKKKIQKLPVHCKWITKQKTTELAVPRIIEKYLEAEFDIKK